MSVEYTLVTGGAGFIGSQLTSELASRDIKVLAIDCFLADSYSSDLKRARWQQLKELNIGNLTLIEFDLRTDNFDELKKYKITTIFNEAAMPGLNNNWSLAEVYYENNITALNRLLEFAKSLDLKSFIHASTSSVYGKEATGDEKQDLMPISPYGVSKLAAEKLLLAYKEWFSIPVKILRYFSVYGPYQRPDMAYSRIIEAIKTGSEFVIYGDGEQKRSNTFIDDIVEATILADMRAEPGDIINVCGDETISLNRAISIIEELMGKRLNKKFGEVRTGDQRDTSGINLLAKKRLGWNASVKFHEGIYAQVKASLT